MLEFEPGPTSQGCRVQRPHDRRAGVGYAIADVLDLDVSIKAHKVKIKAMLK